MDDCGLHSLGWVFAMIATCNGDSLCMMTGPPAASKGVNSRAVRCRKWGTTSFQGGSSCGCDQSW